MFACKSPIYRGLRHLCELYSFLLFEKIVNDWCRFSERNVTFGRIFENQSGYSRRTSGVWFAEMLATDIKMNDETDEF